MSKEMLTAEEIAKYLRLHPYTIRRLARAGKLPGFKIGGQWRFKKESFEKTVKQKSSKKPNR